MTKLIEGLDAVADELVERLDLMGLPARRGALEDEEGGQYRALAKWKVAPGSAVHIYMYAAPYFGSHPLWFGFGARSAIGVDLITRGFDPAAFSTVAYSDWNDGYDLVDDRKMKEVRRNEYTVREDYRRQQGLGSGSDVTSSLARVSRRRPWAS